MENINTSEIPVAVVGLGLMGCSITTCLLIAGHPVVALAPISADLNHAESRINKHFERSFANGIVQNSPEHYLQNLTITEDYADLKNCKIVLECTIENIDVKASVFGKIEPHLAEDALLTSNTSAIPITQLQALTGRPERFFGLHWAEPSHTTRFLEIICGDQSNVELGEYLYQLSHQWAKEPILVRKDIPGFITNRLMYAMYREAFHLVENGYATIEDVDRSCRNNAGYFMTLVGVFRWMDLTGVKAYHTVMKNLFPTLHNGTEVPKLIDEIVKRDGNGVSNANGFYDYSDEEAEMWEKTFTEFTYKIRELALQYPSDIVKQKMNKADVDD
ncbi:3-hydroxyacyl-CoA dehydrogenase family protein [Membranihabitans marinus]|uniref:3-hydroxyacyl-CoA dehydrogenase family protein n=1 Tax=Membranihabitans marinus TaxID=1227546 RepID=UPI001F230B9D|nr:3-hydroxyacyl-CoA dehydrogenase family protein [Membranihabitans marinus]